MSEQVFYVITWPQGNVEAWEAHERDGVLAAHRNADPAKYDPDGPTRQEYLDALESAVCVTAASASEALDKAAAHAEN